ncbi:MAG: site-specific DNA-methyltransferase [Clostridia bacterium]|nr:site-specific DNA-methyltransferase [Clostridia bacterium]
MTTLPLYEHIKTIFKGTDFTSSDGEFLTGKIFEAIERVDRAFMAILLKDTTAKSHFFDAIEEAYVLNQTKLYEFFNAKEYFDNSYTSYTNKIGLIKKESFIKKFDDVVLAFPYKDCVLEGGMSNEEASKKEVFYNSIISKDEIDRLFEPKVLTNITKFDTNGQHKPESISMDDNLIIKGNNLLALHSLKQRYAGQIKLIYIDPPYNTGNDGFKYNDRFNHSTWLTFMKNRLEVARELLRDDGVIFVSIDDREQAYLKILMDEIFGRDNFLANINRIQQKGKNKGTFFNVENDYIIVYSKKSTSVKINKLKKSTHISHYPLKDKIGVCTDFTREDFKLLPLCDERISCLEVLDKKISREVCLKHFEDHSDVTVLSQLISILIVTFSHFLRNKLLKSAD